MRIRHVHGSKGAAGAAVVAVLAGCSGVIERRGQDERGLEGGAPSSTRSGSPSGPPGSAPGTPSDPAAIVRAPGCTAPAAGRTPLRRLTRREYNRTVQDLLGDTTRPADQFAADESAGSFAVGGTVSAATANDLRVAAEALARSVVDPSRIFPCDPKVGSIGDDGCARKLIADFGRRAFRRPLAPEEIAALYDRVYAKVKGPYGYARGVRAVVQAILQSPSFLYRVELGAPAKERPGLQVLSGYEVATRLSYALWNRTPDETLLSAAAAGELDTADGLARHARRMLLDARARSAVSNFHEQWLDLDKLQGIEKDATLFPEFTASLRAAMGDETRRFLEHVIFERDAALGTLLTAPFSFVNPALAKLYGAPTPASSSFANTTLPAGQRAGILTHASLLSVHSKTNMSAPIRRGVFVRAQLLCDPPPPTPPDVPEAPNPKAGISTRELFKAHTESPSCRVCHERFDPIGWGFESYDAIGRFRTLDAKVPVDASGQIVGTRDADGPFSGAVDLARRLSRSAQVSDCIARQWFVYTLGREPAEADECAIASLNTAFTASNGNVRELIVSLVRSDAFRYTAAPQVAAGP